MAIKARATETIRTEISREWTLHLTNWQLPCGCISPDIWSCSELRQSECTHCHRRWSHMGARGWRCEMMDGKPQGKPLYILTSEMIDKPT